MAIVTITKDNYDDLVLNSEKKVLLDFWATWCGPCRMLSPIVEEIAREREDLLVGKVNVDEQMELALEFGVASIPTLVLLKGGETLATSVGYCDKAELTAFIAGN